MDKQNMAYPDKRILFDHEKEWSTDTCYNMNEPWKIMLNEKKKKPDTYCMIPFLGTAQKRQIHRGRKQIGDCLGLGGGRREGNEEWLLKRYGVSQSKNGGKN